MSTIPKHLRVDVEKRAQWQCEYCRIPKQGQVGWFPIHHIKPLNVGGETSLTNLALACPRCNGHKWAFETGTDPQTETENPLFNPRTQRWNEHFEWDADGSLKIHGKTPIGRATIERLRMNASEILAIRRLLADLGIQIAE